MTRRGPRSDGAPPRGQAPTPVAASQPGTEGTPPVAISPTPVARSDAGLDAALLTPNVLRVKHWNRLLGGLLYAASPRVLQLNRGESRHDLARRLFFANRGVFRSGDYAEIMNNVSALSVLSNAVLVWNTVRIGAIVDELEAGGQPVSRDDLARVSPLLDAHVIATGSYNFDRAVRRARPQENQGAVA